MASSAHSDIAAALVGFGVATLHEAMGRRGLASGLRLLVGGPFAGQAITVELPAGDNLGIHALLKDAPAGSVACIGSAGRGVYGVIGDLLVLAAAERKLAAFVIDDGIRDIGQLAGPPSVAARGVSAFGTQKRRIGSINAPVSIGNVLVRPGDWVVGDADGIVLIPDEERERVMIAAQARTMKEESIRTGLRGGRSTAELLNLGHLLEKATRLS